MNWFRDSIWPVVTLWWGIAGWVIRVVMLFVVPNRRPPAQARAWLFFIFFLPVPGLIAYNVFGRAYIPKRLTRLRRRVVHQLARANRQWGGPAGPPFDLQGDFHALPALVQRIGGFPVARSNRITILDTWPAAHDALIADIDAAQRSVHLLYYIFQDDVTGRRTADAVIRAAGRGVQCRILMDAVGSSKGLRAFRKPLEAAGVEVVEMMPVRFFQRKTARFDLRNHRKIAIIDGKTGHIGSNNISDPPCRKDRVCEEMTARVEGPAAAHFQVLFLSDRYLEKEDEVAGEALFPRPEPAGSVSCQLLPSGPGYEFSNLRKVITTVLYNARKRVTVTTPYFIPDSSYINALQSCALRGVDVTLIVPILSDSRIVTLAQESFFEQLLESGVKIFCFEPTLLHAKHITIDDEIALLGSANMDIRSFDLNRECLLVIYDEDCVRTIGGTQQRYLREAVQITKESWARRPRGRIYLQNLARLLDAFL